MATTLWVIPIAGAHASGAAVVEPQPPCQAEAYPTYPSSPGRLKIQFWDREDLDLTWRPPECTGWQAQEFSVMLAAAGRFNNSRGLAGILEKVARVSGFTGLRYWSVTRGRWMTLIDEAYALEGPAREQRRKDFDPGELQVGREFHYWQKERTTAGSVTYRFRILERSPERLVLGMENASPGRVLGLPVLGIGMSQYLYFFERLAGGEWGYYCLARVGRGMHEWLPLSEASYANRASAVFRHFAGLQEDELPVWKE